MPSKEEVYKLEYKGPVVNDCSGYVRNVNTKLNLNLPSGQADDLISFINAHWVRVGKGVAGGPAASDFAGKGYVVMAVLKAKDHHPFKWNPQTQKYDIPHFYKSGHVAIVLPKSTGDYPYVICGSDGNGKSDGSKKVYQAGHATPWRGIDAPKVEYYRTPTPVPDPKN